MKKILFISIIVSSLFSKQLDFTTLKETNEFINVLAKEYGFSKKELLKTFKKVKFLPDVLKIYNVPFNRYKTDASWTRYRTKIITPKRIEETKSFIKKYSKVLKKAEKTYKVPKEYIASYISIESHFGKNTGSHSVLDSLSTLAFFKNRKQKFFLNELKELFLLSKNKKIDIKSLKGSFAGAMGCVQQLPSVHNKYGIDFDKNGKKDLWNIDDCIGTIANFMHLNGWKNSHEVAIKAKYPNRRYRGLRTGYNRVYKIEYLKRHHIVPSEKFNEKNASLLQLRDIKHDELWLGTENFRTLTSYNHSTNYGMAIYFLSKNLK